MREKTSSKEETFWSLIGERAALERSGKQALLGELDAHIWQIYGHKAAVMFTDLSGFSRQVATFGILHFLQLIFAQKSFFAPIVERNVGTLLKQEADSLLILFPTAQDALRCAIEMQQFLEKENQTRTPENQILLCVGIGYGEMLQISDHDVYGREVNAASKLGEDTAKAYEILMTTSAKEALVETEGLRFEKLSEEIPGSEENYKVLYPRVG